MARSTKAPAAKATRNSTAASGLRKAAVTAWQQAKGNPQKAVAIGVKLFAACNPTAAAWQRNPQGFVKGYLAGAQRRGLISGYTATPATPATPAKPAPAKAKAKATPAKATPAKATPATPATPAQ